MINKLKFDNECLKIKLHEIKSHSNDNYKGLNNCLQNEIIQKNEKINCINNDLATINLKEENKILKVIFS
jgi:hypothetical protein